MKLTNGFPGGSVIKNLPTNAGDIKDASWIPGSGKFPGGEGMATHSSILAWRIPWTEEPGGLQSTGSKRDMTEVTKHNVLCIFCFLISKNLYSYEY